MDQSLDMASHHRVVQIRAESGIPPLPPAPQPEFESEEVRNARFNELQRESLGSRRRDRISKEDYPENRRQQVSWEVLEAARLSSKPGTPENEEFRANEVLLTKWNNAWTELEDDGTIEEQFDDINRGQTHRAKLMSDPDICRAHGLGDEEINLRRHHADNGGRARGGGRGGRGGGFVGSRSRVSGPKRVPVGTPPTGIPTAAHRPITSLSSFHPAPVLTPPRGGGGPSHRPVSPTRRGEVYTPGPLSPSRVPLSPGQPTRPPREPGWAFRLADPADFVTAFRGSLVVPSTVAPAKKGTTAPADTPSSSAILTTAKAAQGDTASLSPAVPLTTAKIAAGDPTTPDITEQQSVTGPVEQSWAPGPKEQSLAPHLSVQRLTAAPPEQPAADSRQEPSTTGSLEQPFAKLETVSSTVTVEAEAQAEADEESALIDFGASDSDHEVSYSHETDDAAKGVRAIASPLTHARRPEQSYAGDLLGLDIPPNVGQTLRFQEHRKDPMIGKEDMAPSIVEIHDKMSSLKPLLRGVLEPGSVKSFESILTELQLKSKRGARTSEVAPGIEPPTAEFGRLSIHEQAIKPDTTSVVAKESKSAASLRRSTVSSYKSTSTATDPVVIHPRVVLPPPKSRVVLPPPELPVVETAGNVQQKMSPYPDPDISRRSAGIHVHDQVASTAIGVSVSRPFADREIPSKTANQKISFKLPAPTSRVAKEPAPSLLGKGEDSEEDYPLDAITHTIHPQTSGTTINRIGLYKGQALQSKKENAPLAGKHDDQAKASSAQSRAVLSLTGRTAASKVTTNEAPVPLAQPSTGNVLANPTLAPPALTPKMSPIAKPFISPHRRTASGDVATSSVSGPANPSSLGMPGVAKSQGQIKREQPTTASSVAEKAGKKDEEEEEDYPLEAILKTTSVPSGPSMLNRTGFYKR